MEKFRNWYEENGKAILRQETDLTNNVGAISSTIEGGWGRSEETKEEKEKKKKKK
jgi:hypothetical protein